MAIQSIKGRVVRGYEDDGPLEMVFDEKVRLRPQAEAVSDQG